MRILILGSTGFIGSHLYKALHDSGEHDVLAPTRASLDLLDQEKLSEQIKAFGPEVIVNCAIKVDDIVQSLRANLNVIRSTPADCVYFQVGSGAEYGRYECPSNVHESFFGSVIPVDTYGICKYLVAQTLTTSLTGRFLSLRTFGVFGKGEEMRRLIPSLVVSAHSTGKASISKDGLFSYVSVNDLVDFFTGWLRRGCYLRGHYNFAGHSPIYLSAVLRRVELAFPSAIYSISEGLAMAAPYCGNSSNLLAEGNWFNFRNLDDEIDGYIDELKRELSND
jgi:nucleoside-diphosphate-sugar epimerase